MKVLKPCEFADRIGVSVYTLRRWDNEGTLPAKKTPGGRRFYTQTDVELYFRSAATSHDGRWICLDGGKVQCSVCGATYDYDDNYCGGCGARMVWDKREADGLNDMKHELEAQ